jgi:hypothetical protein
MIALFDGLWSQVFICQNTAFLSFAAPYAPFVSYSVPRLSVVMLRKGVTTTRFISIDKFPTFILLRHQSDNVCCISMTISEVLGIPDNSIIPQCWVLLPDCVATL